MAKIKNYITTRNLDKYSVYQIDGSPTSTYFQVSEVPDTLTGGKNSFLINGSPFLKESSEVLIEIVDSTGNAIFLKPIPRYYEGLSRVVSIEVYDDTARGTGRLTILGEAKVLADGSSIPEEWIGKYNIKFSKDINIEPRHINITPVRLYNTPTVEIEELVMPARVELISSSVLSVTGGSTVNGYASNININSIFSEYSVIKADTNFWNFTREMIGGGFTASINSVLFTSSIKDVKNSRILTLDYPYISGSFTTSTFSISYIPSSSYSTTANSQSFAIIRLQNLTTFSGDIARGKFYVKSSDSVGNYELIGDASIGKTELLLTQSKSTGETNIEIGYFRDQNFSDTYWRAGAVSSSDYLGI